MADFDHNRIIAKAAQHALGFRRYRRSRLWLADGVEVATTASLARLKLHHLKPPPGIDAISEAELAALVSRDSGRPVWAHEVADVGRRVKHPQLDVVIELNPELVQHSPRVRDRPRAVGQASHTSPAAGRAVRPRQP